MAGGEERQGRGGKEAGGGEKMKKIMTLNLFALVKFKY